MQVSDKIRDYFFYTFIVLFFPAVLFLNSYPKKHPYDNIAKSLSFIVHVLLINFIFFWPVFSIISAISKNPFKVSPICAALVLSSLLCVLSSIYQCYSIATHDNVHTENRIINDNDEQYLSIISKSLLFGVPSLLFVATVSAYERIQNKDVVYL
ncbi:hypothetical protein HL033_03250 [Neoehrlichia mikurensis]|uniref:Uncharacterized protein n=1 Tax=Neoehrlichia mikurensis TaxID=89586 RepID=A0A9Q9BTJ3_9RICK|nr:hypothetical protein [Neoehrlichia mikurensis]QXK91758.1 hypothetical protein IAH97_03245 [Neoehrlichia mikurensis]QXK93448.1 hypothetical protein HL033_03250 [Neoehrlichia mikurensis]UTO55597.1 hypothetical protein LUA82_00695 [Neoehrlichia mikurensis]UTO56518.1 hypothetical protein LUA81_00695 [Neoehrlichia mikurensis]